MLASPVYTETHPPRSAKSASRMNLRDAVPAASLPSLRRASKGARRGVPKGGSHSSIPFTSFSLRTLASHFQTSVSSDLFEIKRFRTLCKIPGIGYPLPSILFSILLPRGSARNADFLAPSRSEGYALSLLFATHTNSSSRNPFVCHSYENNRGVYQLFPLWNSRLARPPWRAGRNARSNWHRERWRGSLVFIETVPFKSRSFRDARRIDWIRAKSPFADRLRRKIDAGLALYLVTDVEKASEKSQCASQKGYGWYSTKFLTCPQIRLDSPSSPPFALNERANHRV